MSYRAITLHDKHSEDIVGTVLLKPNVDIATLRTRWDDYQEDHKDWADDEADIYDFVAKGNWDVCDVLELEFYQP